MSRKYLPIRSRRIRSMKKLFRKIYLLINSNNNARPSMLESYSLNRKKSIFNLYLPGKILTKGRIAIIIKKIELSIIDQARMIK